MISSPSELIQHECHAASPLESRSTIPFYFFAISYCRTFRFEMLSSLSTTINALQAETPPLTSILFEINFRPAPGPSDSEHADCNPSTDRKMSLAGGGLVRGKAAVMVDVPPWEGRLVSPLL